MALTIAGSDSGGGAGIQADLKTFAACGVFGTSAITCVTAQNPAGVTGIEALNDRFVALQIRTVCDEFPVAAAKTGMLFSASLIRAVAKAVRRAGISTLVVDPVMIATSGASLLRADAVRELCRALIPMATVITPNLPEAEALLGDRIETADQLRRASRSLSLKFGVAVALKGGHLPGGRVVDVLFERGRLHEFVSPRVAAKETHGTGCTFSAALTACLARGLSLPESVGEAKRLVASALRRSRPAGRHWPLHVA